MPTDMMKMETERKRSRGVDPACKHSTIHRDHTHSSRSSSHCDSGLRTWHSIHEDSSSIPGLAQWVKDLAMLWLWCRLTAAAPIRHLAQEIPYAAGAAPKMKRKKKKGVPIVAQQKRIWLASIRTQVQTLASLNELRIQHCCELWCRS